MRYQAAFQLTIDDHLALRRYLIEERGIARDQLRAGWRRVVVVNAIMGLLVGVWLTGTYGQRFSAGGVVGYATVFVVSVTLFWALSGTLLWVVRLALGGRQGELRRALARVRQRLEESPHAAPTGPYAVTITQRGVTEQLNGEERTLPWQDVERATRWRGYVMIDTADGLAVALREEAVGGPDEVQALVDGVAEWAG